MRFLPDQDRFRVAVIGFGYVGSCIAATLADRGFDVVGVDTDPRLVDELARGHCRFAEEGLAELIFRGLADGNLRVTTDIAEAGEADVILIAVGTPVREDGSLAEEQLRGACRALGEHLRPGQLVVLKSTVPPGTTRGIVLSLLEEESGLLGGVDFGLAFTPERLAEGTALRELRTFPIVAGGLGAESEAAAEEFWRRALGVEVIPRDSLEAAEIVKLASNWWIDLNIALANELAMFCALYGVDVLDVITAANTIPKGAGNVNILLPSVGVGGSCLTKDPWMVWRSAERHGLPIRTAPAGREVNAGMPEYTAQLAIDELVRQGKNPTRSKVAVLGLAFKNDTGDLRATPTVGAVKTLAKAGLTVSVHDPLVDPDAAEELFGIRPTASLEEAVRDADCLAILALHRDFHDIDFAALPVAAHCLVLDGRAYYPKEKIDELRAAGYVYRGIGRGDAIPGTPTETETGR
ncbi:nucleotide sugar dehydrogenase [Amycolatopsis tolypomycina]|uniref:UDP-N-acetyl-D-mannosaminuronic acid dehydrogenase n=1 Tax=Amycolatopsis tolypomycina TaxID=208445 RepID=A0A1H4ZWC6_9PSEU|nr:nucleotide sugar dehydrogenase [Amycolatopsis tolypomycina]SED34383.1 UDP-N-acetyl-D-mannosaminuronic acid dehydrogenase [Amycolatopsis tolypomycina]